MSVYGYVKGAWRGDRFVKRALHGWLGGAITFRAISVIVLISNIITEFSCTNRILSLEAIMNAHFRRLNMHMFMHAHTLVRYANSHIFNYICNWLEIIWFKVIQTSGIRVKHMMRSNIFNLIDYTWIIPASPFQYTRVSQLCQQPNVWHTSLRTFGLNVHPQFSIISVQKEDK